MVGLHRCYQANTVKTGRVLLFDYLGLRGFVDKHFKLPCEQYEVADLKLRTVIVDNFNNWIFVETRQTLFPFTDDPTGL